MNSATTRTDSHLAAQAHIRFYATLFVSAFVFWKTLFALVAYSLHNESASHVILIPFVSAYLLYVERKRIFSAVRPSFTAGACVVLLGVGLYSVTIRNVALRGGDESLSLSASVLALVLIWAGGFLCFYGLAAFRRAAFPLLFLLLMVPLPANVLAWVIHTLQEESTELTYLLFKMLGVPVFRQGFVLSVPGVSIEVAAECSGIRSSIALFVTCLLAAHFYLRTPWKILLFMLLVLPLAVIKNGIRIVTLTLLSIYVDPSFLHGNLHREGGFVFFLLALLLLLPVLLVLEKSENRGTVLKVPQSATGD